MDYGSASEEIDAFARQLFHASDAGGVWEAEDEITRLYYRRLAQQRLAVERYTQTPPP